MQGDQGGGEGEDEERLHERRGATLVLFDERSQDSVPLVEEFGTVRAEVLRSRSSSTSAGASAASSARRRFTSS
jgi:hypothetical protein